MYQLLREHPMAFDVEERMSWRGRLHLEHAFDDKAIRRAEEKSILRATTRDLLPELISERSRAPIPRPRVQPTSRRCVMPWPPSRPIATRRWRPLDSSRIQQTLAKPLGSVSPMYERLAVDLAERVRRQPRTLVPNRM
jgi:asparagine synthase (glutamine-hydrolysing)